MSLSDNGEVESLRQALDAKDKELRSNIRQLEEQDRELLKLHERNGDLELEVQNLNEQLEKERADREKIETELSDLKQNFAPAATLTEKLTPDLFKILDQVRAKCKKIKIITLPDLEVILQILESSAKKIEDE